MPDRELPRIFTPNSPGGRVDFQMEDINTRRDALAQQAALERERLRESARATDLTHGLGRDRLSQDGRQFEQDLANRLQRDSNLFSHQRGLAADEQGFKSNLFDKKADHEFAILGSKQEHDLGMQTGKHEHELNFLGQEQDFKRNENLLDRDLDRYTTDSTNRTVLEDALIRTQADNKRADMQRDMFESQDRRSNEIHDAEIGRIRAENLKDEELARQQTANVVHRNGLQAGFDEVQNQVMELINSGEDVPMDMLYRAAAGRNGDVFRGYIDAKLAAQQAEEAAKAKATKANTGKMAALVKSWQETSDPLERAMIEEELQAEGYEGSLYIDPATIDQGSILTDDDRYQIQNTARNVIHFGLGEDDKIDIKNRVSKAYQGLIEDGVRPDIARQYVMERLRENFTDEYNSSYQYSPLASGAEFFTEESREGQIAKFMTELDEYFQALGAQMTNPSATPVGEARQRATSNQPTLRNTNNGRPSFNR